MWWLAFNPERMSAYANCLVEAVIPAPENGPGVVNGLLSRLVMGRYESFDDFLFGINNVRKKIYITALSTRLIV